MQNTGNGQRAAGSKSVIDRGTHLKGALVASSTVQVLGVLEGEITGPSVEVEPGGVLLGKAKVASLRSRGELAGEFDAEEVELAGQVRDQTIIRARSLLVAARQDLNGEPDALFGECQIDIGEPPSKEEAVARALAAARPTPAKEAVTVVRPSDSGPAPSPVPTDLAAAPDPGGEATPSDLNEGGTAAAGVNQRRKRPAGDRPSEGA